MCLQTSTRCVEIVLIRSESAQKAERGTVTELKKQTLIDFVEQKTEDFYNLISKIALIKVLVYKFKKKRELAGNIDLTVIKGGGGEKIPLRDCSKSPLKIFNTDPFAF